MSTVRAFWLECDNCGAASVMHASGSVRGIVRGEHWIVSVVSRARKHFCSQDCHDEFRKAGKAR